MMRPLLAIGAALSVSAARPASAYCPSYTLSSASNNNSCGIEAAPGTNPTDAEWLPIFDVVARGPAEWGDQGPSVADIGEGCGKPEVPHTIPARFPCELIMAIARQESAWKQFCVPETPADQKGGAERTIISFDCGYGIGQVTSGMHIGETPDFDRKRVAADPLYNLATGARILAAKWKATECVGDNQPEVIEHWYSAAWAYNGLAYSNNPNNPNFDPNRGVWDPQINASAPYQEKVFGRMEHTGGKWVETALAYPNPGEIGTASKPLELSEPGCASPTDCSQVRLTHVTSCQDGGAGGAGDGGASESGGSSPVGVGGSGVGGSGVGADGDGGDGDGMSGTSGQIPGENASCACHLGAVPPDRGPLTGWLAVLVLGVRARSRRPR